MDKNVEKIKNCIRDNDPAAIELIYDMLGTRIYHTLTAILCSETDAQDVMQDLFIRLARKRHLLLRADNLSAYVMTIARNMARSHLKLRSCREYREKHLENYENILCEKNSETASTGTIDIEEIELAFRKLPLKQREIVSMKCFQEMTFREIGDTLRMSQNTVASRYRYGIDKLRISLKDLYENR